VLKQPPQFGAERRVVADLEVRALELLDRFNERLGTYRPPNSPK